MRLTVNLDDELYAVAVSLARESGASVSGAVNTLLRRALEPGPQASAKGRGRATPRGRAGLPLVTCGRSFTSDDVYRLDSESA